MGAAGGRGGEVSARKPASGKPVSGLILREPPLATANACNPLISLGLMCTNCVSLPRPLDCTCLANWCRLIYAS